MTVAFLRRTSILFVWLVSSASPASAGPVDISPTQLCAVMGTQFAGGGSLVVGYPACVGGLPTGLVGGAVALPIAGVAGGVASLWGNGADVFTSVWGVGAYAGFGVGAFVTGYPVYLAKAAVWDGPNNIACAVAERCSGIQPDPGVDYQAKKRDVLLNLPYLVYRPNLPVGFEMTEPTLRSAFNGTHDAVVESAVWRASAKTTGQPPEDRQAWANIYQMEDLGLVPAHCPSTYALTEYAISREFTAPCVSTGTLVNGTQPLYRAESQSSMREMVYAVRLGKGLQRTLFVVEFGSEFDDEEIARLLPMLESMRAVPVMDLISALE